MHAIGEIDVEPARRPEHDPGARCRAPVGMASGVVEAHVRLHLDQSGGPAIRADEQLADQGSGYVARIAGEERRLESKCFQTISDGPGSSALASPCPWSGP